MSQLAFRPLEAGQSEWWAAGWRWRFAASGEWVELTIVTWRRWLRAGHFVVRCLVVWSLRMWMVSVVLILGRW